MATKRWLSWKKILPLFLVGIAILIGLIATIGARNIAAVLHQVDPHIYALAFVVQTLALLVWLAKWKILTMAIDLHVGAGRMFPILLSGIFVNTVVPGARVGGGEPIRAYAFSRLGRVSMGESLATVAADRALDVIPFIIIASVALGVIVFTWHLPTYLLAGLTLALLAVIVLLATFVYLCAKPKVVRRVTQWVVRRFGRIIKRFRSIREVERRLTSFAERFSREMFTILRRGRYAGPALSLSGLYWALTITRMYFVFWALGQPISFGAIGVATVVGLLLHMVPIPGGLGIVEGGYVLIFTAAGVPAKTAATAALLDRGISFWYTGLIGAMGISWTGLKLARS
jgi:hypothetical protein